MLDSNLKSAVIQVAVCTLANWGMVTSGIIQGFPSALMPPLLGSGPGLHTSVHHSSWIVGVTYLSASVMCLPGGYLTDWIGRRWGLLLLNLSFAVGWLLIALFPLSLTALYIGRGISGMGLGLATSVGATYTAEIASDSLRSVLVMFTPVMLSFGLILVYLWAFLYQNSWTELSYFAFGLSMIPVSLGMLLPESPLWLLNRGRAEEALQALQRLRGTSTPEQIRKELDNFSSIVKDKKQTVSWFSTLNHLKQPQAFKPLLIMNVYYFLIHCSGVSIVVVFAVDFARDAGIRAVAYHVALAISLTRIFATFLTIWACNTYGRRKPAIVSGVIMSVSLAILSLSISKFLILTPWLVSILLVVYMLSSSLGFSTLPMSMMGELFPTDVRGLASGLTASMIFLGSFSSVKLYPIMVVTFGSFPVFMFFTISGLFGTIFIYLFLPETNGKTLEEIKEYFIGSTKEVARMRNLFQQEEEQSLLQDPESDNPA
ncbi:facilitated trehalose transporter Tret1-like isoform X1 [Homalodisca vitripennis]|uniref:facilitated trehalose transporter Tret1-like isoform X1 n=1 Tax=Homalodisca vitripennis TaxID=197043 RepID=UPI001EEBCFD7|nr:facilitated trehalose transporter Tret1-like isoform X1 [Homalodisca vitripennis]